MLGTLPLGWQVPADAIRQMSLHAPTEQAQVVSLTDAAEEMAQFFSQARLQERPLKERGLASYQSPALHRVEEVEALLQVIWADRSEQGDAHHLASQLLASAGDPGALTRTLKRIHGSTEQFLLLSKALAQGELRGSGNPALDALRDRLDMLWVRDGVRIRADVNITHELSGAQDKGGVDRQAYHDAVLDGGTLPRTLTLLMARYGEGIEDAVERLRQALGADIGAARPSLPVERLRAILHELFILGALLPFLKSCRDLARRAGLQRRKDLHQKAEDRPGADEGAALLGELAEWVPRWLTQGDVRSLLYHYGLSMGREADGSRHDRTPRLVEGPEAAMTEPDRLLVVVHGLRFILRQVPDRLFPDGEHKINADQVLVSLLDHLILGEADEPPQPQT